MNFCLWVVPFLIGPLICGVLKVVFLQFDTIRLILKAYLWTYLNNNDQVLMLEIIKLFNIVCMPGVYRFKCGKVPHVTVTCWCPRYHVTIFLTANCSKIDQ